ncbi:uncharacterized protein LOC112171985 isoform X3 [Rosa chinensis]|uniref:uncharacterized protein LOC112171985 isoform X3 n=1 Tax=Rosa chinensis TaxID=74649 RepID=UPI000D094789|nr:uncharacterized protein LOC112171985 isoform X3 [Rosa chinensis]
MDFYAMKRKELQALCKKHGIRANMKNTEMAERLTLLLKEDENSITEVKQVEKQLEATEMVIDSVESQKVKKVKFSPDNETFYFVATDKDSDSDCEYKPKKRGGRRKSMGKKVLEKKEVLDVVENAREVEVVEIKDTPVRVTRSRKQLQPSGAVESVFSPGHGQKEVIIGAENVDGKGIKPVKVQKECKAVVLHGGKEVARDEARKRTRNENSEGASQVVPSDVLLPKHPLRRSRRKTTLFSSVTGAEKELGICEAVEIVKLPREPVTRKSSSAAKSGRKSSRNACKKVPAETCDDIIATAVEMDRLVQEFQEPSLLEESSVVVYESLDRSPVLQMGKELERDVIRKRPRNKDFGGNPEVEPGLENLLPPKARSRRSNSKTALLTESMPAENNSPLEEPKIDVGLEIQEPAGNENETDSCFNKAVEKSRKKRKGSSKKTESATKDQPVSLAASTVYSDIEKATDILAHLNGNRVVEFVNFQGTSMLHKEQNDEQPIINHIKSVAVEDAIFSNSTVGVMDDPCLSFNRKDTDQENTVEQNPVASPGNLCSVVVSPNACVRDVHSFTYRSECEGQTSNLLDLNEGSESEESLIVKSISRRGGVLDDQLANGVIASVSEDQKSIDNIVMVQVDMDSKKPAEAAAETVGEMHAGSTVPSDTTPIDSSLVKQVGNEFQAHCVGGININHIGTNFSSTCVSEVPDETTSSWNEEILCNHDSTKEVMPADNESAKALDSAQMIPIVTEEILHQAIERNSNFDESVLLDSHNTDDQVAEVKFPEISDVTEDIEEKYENESSYGERTEEVVPADNESVEELDIAQTLPTGIDEVNGGTEKSSNLDESALPDSNNTDGQVAEDKFSNESIVNGSEEIKDKCEHESSVGDRSPITLAERIMDTFESGTIPVVLKSDGDAQNSSSCGVSCSNDEYEQGNKLKAQGIHLCEEVEGLLHGSKYQNLSFDGKIVVNDHIVAPTMNSNLECAMDAVEVENERKSLKGLDIVVSVESEGVVRTSQSALPLDCMNTGDSDLHREGKASFATDEQTYKDENASISDNIRTLGGGIENRMMGSKADMEDYVTYRENNNIGNCLTEGDRYCSKGDKNNQKEKENVDEDLAFQEDEENKEGACKVEEMLDAMPDLSMDKNATSKEHSQELLDIQKGVAEQDVGENSDGQVEVKHSENAIDAGDGKDILEKCDQRAEESILEDNERLKEQDIVSVMIQEYVDGEKERNGYLEVKNPNVSIHEESFSEIVTDQMANEVIEFESQDKVNFGSPDNCKQISSEVEKCVSAASSDSISRDDKTAEGIASAWKMGEDSSSKDIRGGESLSFSISSDGHRHNNDAADITGPGGMEVSKENNVDGTKMVEQKLIGGSLLEARSMSDVKSFSDVSWNRLECDLGYSLHDAVVSCKDPERKNMHMLVGDNASTDGFGMLESVSGEKVDEGLDTGIYGSEDTLNSKETEEILDLHNIGTVATCSADSTEPSMLKPEMGVDSPFSASNYENKALELEAASPILNGFGMKGLFKDDQTSGLKKADSTEPSMLKSEMGVDSPVSASNYVENKALELEAASPILTSFGMKRLSTDDQTAGLEKSGLEMSKGNSKSEHIEDVNNLKESIDNSQVVEELHHQENKVIREVVESKSAQEMYNHCLTGSAIMDTNVHIPSFWDESTEVEPCLDNACAKPQTCNAAAIASEFNVSSSFGDLCDLKEFSKADSESAKEKVATDDCLGDQPSENLRVSEDLEAHTMIGNVMVINQEEDGNSLLSFGYVGANTVSPEKVVGCLENMAAGIEVSNLRLNEAPSSKDSTFDEQSKCNLCDDVLVDGSRDNNAVADKVSTGSTEAIIGIKNVGDGIKSVEKTPQPLEGDHLLEERDSSYGKSFSDISHSRNEGGVFKKRHLSVQEGRGLKAGRVSGLKFEGVNAGIDGFADPPATASRHEIKALENVASPVANSLGMDWLFGDNDEVKKSDAEMSNTNSTSEDVKNGNGGVAIPQVGAGELGEHKHQPIEVGKLKSTQVLGIHCRPCSPVTEISSHAKLDSFREKALEANLERSISVSTAHGRKKNRDIFIPRTPKNLINESDMKENFNARKSEPVTNISSVKPLHGRRALEDLQNK